MGLEAMLHRFMVEQLQCSLHGYRCPTSVWESPWLRGRGFPDSCCSQVGRRRRGDGDAPAVGHPGPSDPWTQPLTAGDAATRGTSRCGGGVFSDFQLYDLCGIQLWCSGTASLADTVLPRLQ